MFKVTESRQRPKFDTFQKAIFCNSASSTNFAVKAVPIAAVTFWR